jgi:hypothetical protein
MIDDGELLDSCVRLARHAVRRGSGAKSVLRNLKTGKYHRLNPTALRMLNTLDGALSVRDAAISIARQYDQEQATVEVDLLQFCHDLLDRHLVVIVQPRPAAES